MLINATLFQLDAHRIIIGTKISLNVSTIAVTDRSQTCMSYILPVWFLCNIRNFVLFYVKSCKIYIIFIVNIYYVCFSLDPGCQNINVKHRCYALDPSCPDLLKNDSNDDDLNISYFNYAIFAGILTMIITIVILISLFLYRRKIRKRNTGMQ